MDLFQINSSFEKVAMATGVIDGSYTVDIAPNQSCILLSVDNAQDDSFTQSTGDHLYLGNQICLNSKIKIQQVHSFTNKTAYRMYKWWEDCWTGWMII